MKVIWLLCETRLCGRSDVMMIEYQVVRAEHCIQITRHKRDQRVAKYAGKYGL